MSSQMLCQFNGLWTEKPSCSKPVTTGELEFTSNLHQNFKYLFRDFNLDCSQKSDCSQKIRLLSKNHISHAFVTDGQCGNLNSLNIYSGCQDPGNVPNAVRTNITSFNFGGQVTFQCNAAYAVQFLGQDIVAGQRSGSIFCQNTGQWTAKPICFKRGNKTAVILIIVGYQKNSFIFLEV